ncbi:potassium channel family protein [[Mycoplasma] gypis]|uniref:TrkA family potassium uptake protein n=1 Tax=[Mycoplasma] gypis TaxID=92404 RepID=A0ABZ2RNX0_9BACT|nr:TrkA family potassium uptake protein [[Mycoplasma] gypis]MBN0919269.1 TrkA family potassium uptake protein [[Mycoplasma] gypis]
MKKNSKNIAEICIIGLGRYGQSVVQNLLKNKSSNKLFLTLIDEEERNLIPFRDDVNQIFVADAGDPKTLQSIGLSENDTVVVATGENIEIVAALQEIGVKNIIARSNSIRHARVLKQIGVNVIISPQEEAGIKTALIVANQSLISYSQDLEDAGDGFVFGSAFIKNKSIFHKTIRELDIRKRNASIVLIKRGGTSFLPEGDFVIEEGDLLTVIGQIDDITSIFDWFSENDEE